jgi:GNAT superfamily N-acetyltransferase
MTIPYTICPARFDDSEAIAALLTELNREEGHDVVASKQEIACVLFGATPTVKVTAMVAEHAGEVVAVLLYYPGYDVLSSSYGHHLADIIVSKVYRKQGIGKALVKALAQQTLTEEKEWVSLTVLKRNSAAREFYAALGMTQVDVDFFAIGKTALAQL